MNDNYLTDDEIVEIVEVISEIENSYIMEK